MWPAEYRLYQGFLRLSSTLVSGRDFVKIKDAARLLAVSEETLRNWDRLGKLQARRHPVNGYRMYRVADLHAILGELSDRGRGGLVAPREDNDQLALPLEAGAELVNESALPTTAPHRADIPHLHWSLKVALDPKHRPQRWSAPSSTVRKDWRKYPQEAHVLDRSETRYRRFTVEEIALLQGFDPDVVHVEGLSDRQLIAALGDAVPPQLSKALVRAIDASGALQNRTALEICAGIGGLAEGAADSGLEHLAVIDNSEQCEVLLKHGRPWSPTTVIRGDVREFPYQKFRDRIGLLSGGPPCQPWSQSGLRLGQHDSRDLVGELPRIVGTVKPDVFLFENVPGLLSQENAPYLANIVDGLRNPAVGLTYGVLVALFNAADFGTPQVRRRIFIVGILGAPAVAVHRCFDRVAEFASHRDPHLPDDGRLPWRTVGEILETRGDPGGWRKWL